MTTIDKDQVLLKIGNRIRLLREQKNVSQQDLAALCNFEKGNMSRIEAGRTNPTVFTLIKISKALGVKLKDILDIED
jgi:transcriptional regulator with XRE-family HTH domain